MTRRLLITGAVLLCLLMASPALADITGGVGGSIGTSGVWEASFVGMYDLFRLDEWRVGPLTVPASSVGVVAMTNDFEEGYLGLGGRRDVMLMSFGYNTETKKGEARLTLLGLRF
jgi:hypothetical protein